MTYKKAFTLIELLVVIAIIALLLSIVMPALREAKKQALKVLCSNNEKQIGLSFIMYADENDNNLPLNLVEGWLWDISYSTTHYIMNTGGDRRTFYCPLEKSKGPDMAIFWLFSQVSSSTPVNTLSDSLEEAESGFRVTGYFWLMDTEAGRTASIIDDKPHLWPRKTTEKNPSVNELVTDAILSEGTDPFTTTFTEVMGGSWAMWNIYDRTNHVDRTEMPEDTNILFLDGHVSRRNFNDVQVYFGWPPYFWW